MTFAPLAFIAALALALSGADAQEAALPGTPVESSGVPAQPPLFDTYWKLTELGGKAVALGRGPRMAHIKLQADGQLVGAGGCSLLVSRYQIDGNFIDMGRLASNQMACMRGMKEEQIFIALLVQTRTWQLNGRELVLADADSKPLLRFEAMAKLPPAPSRGTK